MFIPVAMGSIILNVRGEFIISAIVKEREEIMQILRDMPIIISSKGCFFFRYLIEIR